MLIKISIDTWRDIFDWLSKEDRRELSLKFNEVNDREFSAICQKWLHEWTKDVCLKRLWIDLDGESARLLCRGQEVPFAKAQLPANIRDFTRIIINHLDFNVLNFLRRVQPLLQNVILEVHHDNFNTGSARQGGLKASRTALIHLLPLLTGGIDAIRLTNVQLLSTIRDQFPAQFFAIKRLQIEMIVSMSVGKLPYTWLCTRRADGQPRVLIMATNRTLAFELVERVRQVLFCFSPTNNRS